MKIGTEVKVIKKDDEYRGRVGTVVLKSSSGMIAIQFKDGTRRWYHKRHLKGGE